MMTIRKIANLGMVLLVVAFISISIVVNPLIATGLSVIVIVITISIAYLKFIPKFYIWSLSGLLFGYMFMSRGFAHFGIAPIYLGEAVLAFGLIAVLLSKPWELVQRLQLGGLITIFAIWGIFRTVPFLGSYGFDALRDAVVWGYAAYAFLIAVFLVRTNWFANVASFYHRIIPWFLIWVPVVVVVRQLFGHLVPNVPGTSVSLLHLRAGDAAVHLAGVAVFLLLGLHRSRQSIRDGLSVAKEWVWWCIWIVAFLLVSNRAGLVTGFAVLAFIILIRPWSGWGKVAAVMLVVSSLFFAFDTELRFGARAISPQLVVMQLHSVVTTSEESRLENTRRWRLQWWTDIVNYTFFGEYFWLGKGYGINLATADGYQVLQDDALRSPHNSHLTILARSGVPGFTLWVVLQFSFLIAMLRAYFKAMRFGHEWWARFNLWILAYWLACMVNMSFDVFLEGPQGGIWFWSLFGIGMALLFVQRDLKSKVREVNAL